MEPRPGSGAPDSPASAEPAARPSSGWARRRRTARRVATVSARGESLSWGSVSQAGKTATSVAGR